MYTDEPWPKFGPLPLPYCCRRQPQVPGIWTPAKSPDTDKRRAALYFRGCGCLKQTSFPALGNEILPRATDVRRNSSFGHHPWGSAEMSPRKKPTADAVSKGKQPAKPRRSKLAQENDITAEDEREIKEAWQLFSQEGIECYEDEKQGVIRTQDVRKCMTAQGIAPSNAKELAEYIEILDPENEGYVTYANFVAVSALKINTRGDESTREEVERAYRMFTRGTDGPINIHHLRRIAKELKEDIGDDLLKHMILEANGGTGVNKGVGVNDFKGVMMRAGVFQ